jgi:hypothetical protein
MLDRTEHVEWCKKRAREYLDQGDVANAITSILSDMPKHPECGVNPMLGAFGLLIAQNNDSLEARRFIEGFN